MRGFQRMRGGVSAVATVQRSAHGASVGTVPHHSAAGAAQRDAGSRPANLVYPASRLPLQARWMCPSWSEQQARFMSIDKYSLFGGDEAGDQRTSVDSYNKHGFMVNSVLIQGAVILLPETTLLWNVTKMEDITSESLIALRLLLTKPELCIFGTGRRLQRPSKALDADMKAMGIPYDIMDTVNALATFNVLNEEGRNVVGAFLPLDPIEVQQTFSSLSRPEKSQHQGPSNLNLSSLTRPEKSQSGNSPPQVRGSATSRTPEQDSTRK